MDVGTKRLFKIQSGDLVFSNVFAWEGAIAVADERDDGRVGSHRFMTCVPHPKVATPNFLKFYFLTEKGLQKIGEASPGGAGRNRTLGLNKLDVTTVPVPPLDKQHWFDDLQSRVQKIRDLRAAMATEIDALLPAMLHRVFNGVCQSLSRCPDFGVHYRDLLQNLAAVDLGATTGELGQGVGQGGPEIAQAVLNRQP